ncbi:MAG: glycosyltransferase [Gammaproteobacteria bacterium]|nr:glycosyltransferase [Gammaproteobacteria bacterium]
MRKSSIAFIDINTIPFEGFTSGLLISVKEILLRLKILNHKTHIISFSQRRNLSKKQILYIGIEIEHYFFSKNQYYFDQLKLSKSIKKIIIEKYDEVDVFIMCTPAVFPDPIYLIILAILKQRNKKIKIIAFDDLLPKNSIAFIKKYINSIRELEVFAVSNTIKLNYEELLKKKVVLLPNIYNLNKVISRDHLSRKEYITMINTHPIKGVEIFKRIAMKMPAQKFLIIKNWVDVPEFKSYSSNVILRKFTNPIKKIYAKTKILIVPSLCEEGSARVVVEAALNGIPVIANAIGSLVEYKGIAIFMTPPNIQGYQLKKTILYPIVNDNELDDCINNYIKQINRLNNEPNYVSLSVRIKDKAHVMVNKWDREFQKIIEKW